MNDLVNHFGYLEKGNLDDIFTSLVFYIVGQMLSINATHSISKRLQQAVGKINPVTIFDLGIDGLQNCGISRRKAEYIWKLSDDVTRGRYNFENLDDKSDEDVIAYLMQIKGVGRWTAEMIVEFTMGRLNIFSYDDVALKNGIKKAHGFKILSKQRFERMRKMYSPYCTVASLYYYALNDEGVGGRISTLFHFEDRCPLSRIFSRNYTGGIVLTWF